MHWSRHHAQQRLHATIDMCMTCRCLQIMRKLSGAKDKMGLRVHGLIVGSPEKKRADPAVLRALCTAYLPNGRSEVQV